MLKTLSITQLRPGMFVKSVSKQKKKLKIKTHGWVRSLELIEKLKQEGILELIVDLDKSEHEKTAAEEIVAEAEQRETKTPSQQNKDASNVDDAQTKQRKKDITLEQEFSKASETYDKSVNTIKTLYNDISLGNVFNTDVLQGVATDIVDSVFRNENAMAVLTRLRDKNAYAWRHAINCTILVAVFTRYLNYKKDTVLELALGALLHDLGQAKIPAGILSKPTKLSELEIKAVQRHVSQGFNLIKTQKGITPVMLDMIVNHHERLDGSGYPRGLTAEKLKTPARIMAIIDAYSAMTADRLYKDGIEPVDVLRHLLAKKHQFDPVLVQKFIKCMGVHPVGSIVKLTSDRLAIVLEGNRNDPVRPKIKVFYNAKHNHYITSKDIHLSKHDLSLKIVSGIKPQDHEINLSRLLRDQLIA